MKNASTFFPGLALAAMTLACQAGPPAARPNILMIIIDDHAANMTSIQGESEVQTPAMERLAARGAWFSRAYAAAPVCNPSRVAFLTGVNPSNSGVYYNSQAYRLTKRPISQAVTLQKHFKENGYLVAGYGKIHHTPFQEENLGDFTSGYFQGHDSKQYVRHDDADLVKNVPPHALRQIEGVALGAFGPLPDDWDRDDPDKLQQDTEQANHAIRFLGGPQAQPFFLTVGFWRPHTLRIVPQRYFDLYPLDRISIPAGYQPGDLDDVPGPGRWLAARHLFHAGITGAGMWREYLQAKYASTSYIDEQIGRVLTALEKSPHANNTIIVLLADNGYDTGEKDKWSKFALWEHTCRVVFSISGPGIATRINSSPVGLIDIYPTLLGLTGLAPPSVQTLDGVDLTPMLRGKTNDRGKPVVTSYGIGNHSVRDARYRYIRYRNGDEELYDHDTDPYEWTNRAAEPALVETKARLARWLPAQDAPEIERVRAPDPGELIEEVFMRWEPNWNRNRMFNRP